jgi:hypothetical protein
MGRYLRMAANASLSDLEVASLKEVGRGVWQYTIPQSHADRLTKLGLVYRVLGGLRITSAGRTRIGFGDNTNSFGTRKNAKS